MHKKTLIILISFVGFMLSCKKGENDPFLSLATRKARLVGEWNISSIEATTTKSYPYYFKTVSTSYDGEREITVIDESNSSKLKDTVYYTKDIIFSKDFTYSSTKTTTNQQGITQSTITIEGNWAFLGKNKSSGLKNKEAIVLSKTKEIRTTISPSYSQTEDITGFKDGEILFLDQLKKKEIIIKVDSKSEYSDSYGGNSADTYISTTTLTHK